MDAELREYLEVLHAGQERLETRLESSETRLERSEALLVGLEVRIDGLDSQTQRLNEKIDAHTQMLRADMQEMERRLVESIRNRQTDEDMPSRKLRRSRERRGIWSGGSKR